MRKLIFSRSNTTYVEYDDTDDCSCGSVKIYNSKKYSLNKITSKEENRNEILHTCGSEVIEDRTESFYIFSFEFAVCVFVCVCVCVCLCVCVCVCVCALDYAPVLCLILVGSLAGCYSVSIVDLNPHGIHCAMTEWCMLVKQRKQLQS